MANESDNQLKYLKSGMAIQNTCADIVGRIFEGQERDQAIQGLRKGMAEYIKEEKLYNDTCQALKAVEQHVDLMLHRGEMVEASDIDAMFEAKKLEYCKVLDEDEVSKHEEMMKFNLRAKQVSLPSFADEFQGTYSTQASQLEEDDDVIPLSATGTTIDPITKREMSNPVRNKACGHVYERSSILELLTINKNTKCPIAGCSRRDPVQVTDLETHRNLKRIIKAKAKKNME